MSRPPAPRVYLVGAYGTGDLTTSMGRFTTLIRDGIEARGFPVETLKPRALFGRLRGLPGPLRTLGGLVDKLLLFPAQLRAVAARAARDGSPFVFHICDQAYSNYTRTLRSVPHVVTCHDVMGIEAALGRSTHTRLAWNTRLYQRMLLRGLDAAQRVVCVSTTTRDALLAVSKIAPEKVEVILIGPNHPYSPMPAVEAEERLRRLLGEHFGSPFLLHVGANIWYKNREGALRIFARLRALLPDKIPNLVMVGRSPTPAMRAAIAEEGIENCVLPLVNIANEDLRALYSTAEAFLFPSLCEGFGWPILEAQSCGCPVLTTGRPPMTEVGGDCAVYFDPSDPALAARTIASAWERLPALRECGPRNATRFDTPRMLDQYAELYRLLADGR